MASRPRRGAAAAATSRVDPVGLSRCAFYVAANGFGADASRLVCASRAYAHGCADDESFLSGLLLCEKRDVRAGRVVAYPRLIAAARVGDAARVRELVRAGADLHATDKHGHTCLMAAARKQRVAVMRELLSTAGVDGALVRARVAAGLPNAGRSAYSIACYWAADGDSKLSERGRAKASACVALLAASPLQAPGDLGGGDRSALRWTCEARLPGVLSSWLADTRCTHAVVTQRAADGHSAYSAACHWAADGDSKLSERGRAKASACVALLAASPLQAPGDLGGGDRSALRWTCEARLPGVLSSWLADARCTRAALTQRSAGGHSAYSAACHWAADFERELSEAERAAAAACVALLAASPLQAPDDLGGGDRTALTWTCWARLPGVLASWLADARCTRAVLTQRSADGDSAYSLACAWAAETERKLSEAERAAAAACVSLLAASPLQAPGDLGLGDGTALSWTCEARLPGVLSSWLADARCTRAVLTQRNAGGHSAYSIACHWAAETERKLSKAERAAAAACVALLAASPLQAPGDLGWGDLTALTWTCEARLPGVLSSWLANVRCTRAVVTHRAADGHSAYSIACHWAADTARELSEAERAAAAACVALLAASPLQAPGDLGGSDATALTWTCEARLPGVLSSWLADARCTRAVVTQRDADGHSAYSSACAWAADTERELSETERAASASCAFALARSLHISLDDVVDAFGRSALQWACRARLTSVVAAWVALPACTHAVLTAVDNESESPISAACAIVTGIRYSAAERSNAAACVHALAESPHLSAAQRVKLSHAAAVHDKGV